MNIGEAAAASGLSADTIRFYEREGVLPPPPRRKNRYRDYSPEYLSLLNLAATLRDLGLPLHDVASVLSVVRDGSCADVRSAMIETLSGPLGEIEARLARLREARDQLQHVVQGSSLPGLNCQCVEVLQTR